MASNSSENQTPSPPSYVETVLHQGPAVQFNKSLENVNVTQPQHQNQPQVQPQIQVVPAYVVTTQPQSLTFCGNLGEHPCLTTCFSCNQKVTTRVTYKPGMFAWMICAVFIILGLICGCCLIPFFVETFQDAHHSCPHCNANLYVHKKL